MNSKSKIKNIVSNSDAVSPVIGTILMVAVTVVMAAIIGVFVFGMTTEIKKTPSVSFRVSNLADTTIKDIQITHKGGDKLLANLWEVSVRDVGNTTNYTMGTLDFEAGQSLIIRSQTNLSGTLNPVFNSNNFTITGGIPLVHNTIYQVTLRERQTNTVLIDSEVRVTGFD